MWSHFPVNSRPRPLVVPPVLGQELDPAAGFPSVSAKLAFGAGQFKLAAALPHSPRRWEGYPIITAARAMNVLRDSSAAAKTPTGPPLRITRVSLGTARFLTDRGYSRLPAWRIRLAGVSTPAAVLAVGRSAVFTQPRLLPSTHRGFDDYYDEAATVSSDGRTLTLVFVGGPSGHKPCDYSYTAAAAESARAVAVRIYEHPVPDHGPTACSAVGYRRTVKVRLARRLGARVLVDAPSGGVVPVYPPGELPAV